jgi:hypothetical protein
VLLRLSVLTRQRLPEPSLPERTHALWEVKSQLRTNLVTPIRGKKPGGRSA